MDASPGVEEFANRSSGKVVQIQEASKSELMVRMIAAAARDHGPAVFVLGPSVEALVLVEAIVRNRIPVELAAVGANTSELREHVARGYDVDVSRIRAADTIDRAFFGKNARITSRREQPGNAVPPYEYDAVHGMLRFNPLAGWTDAELRRCAHAQGIELFQPRDSGHSPDVERIAA